MHEKLYSTEQKGQLQTDIFSNFIKKKSVDEQWLNTQVGET